MPSVTIAIPTFNRPSLLAEALKSAARQTHADLKIIVSDNASPTNDARAIVKAAKDPRISYFRQKQNIGANANFLWLLDRAETEYFMWLGDDDSLAGEDHVDALVAQFERDPSAKVVFPDADIIGEGAAKSALKKHFCECSTDGEYLTAFCKFGGGQPFYGLYKTSHLRDLDPAKYLRPEWSYFNEGLFLHRMFLVGGARYCPEATLVYNGSSPALIPSRDLLVSFLKYSRELRYFYGSSSLPASELRRVLGLIGHNHTPYIRYLAQKSQLEDYGHGNALSPPSCHATPIAAH